MPEYFSVKIPADVERPDKVLANLTARQVGILAVTVTVIYLGWLATSPLVPAGVYVFCAAPLAGTGALLALARRDGIGLDEFARAALAYRLRPRLYHDSRSPGRWDHGGLRGGSERGVPEWVAARAHHTQRPPRSAPLSAAAMPAREITTPVHGPAEVGVLDLGGHGVAVVAAASTVSFTLRSPTEQESLIGCFARVLHAQTGPVQILVRTHPVDLTPTLAQLAHATTTLAHPALRAAAADHYQWLRELATTGGLLARQVLIVLREPTTTSTAGGTLGSTRHPDSGSKRDQAAGRGDASRTAAAQARLVRRLAELQRALGAADITVTALTPAQLAEVLATSTDPTRHLPAVAAHPPAFPSPAFFNAGAPTSAPPYQPAAWTGRGAR